MTRRSLNSLMMSPFSRLRWRGRERRIGAVAQRRFIDDDVLRVDLLALISAVLKKPSRQPSGRSSRDSAVASACAAGPIEIIEHVPAQDAVDGAGRLREALRRRTPAADRACRP